MRAVTKPGNIRQWQADKAVREYLREKAAVDDYADWANEPFQRPEMHVDAPERFIHPVGFTDNRFKQMKAENGRNVTLRHCQIRTVKLK